MPFTEYRFEEKVGATLKLMTRPADTRLTPQVARDICQRTNSKAYIAGLIARVGSQYVIGLNAVNCRWSDTGATAVEGSRERKSSRCAGNASAKLREELGESLSTVEKFDTPLRCNTPFARRLESVLAGTYQKRHSDADTVPFFKRRHRTGPELRVRL